MALLALIAIVAVVSAFAVWWFKIRGSKDDKTNYPFTPFEDMPVPKPLEKDLKKRDAVLKQNFKPEKVEGQWDAIFIGSGAGSLSTAALLSKTGRKVLILEQHDQAGGCCHTFYEKGFEFDIGIHYIGKCLTNNEFHAYVDQISDGQIQWAPLEADYDHVLIGPPGQQKAIPIYGDRNKNKESLLKYFPGEEKAIEGFYAYLKGLQLFRFQRSRRQSLFMALPKALPMWVAKILVKTGIIHLVTDFFKESQVSVHDLVTGLTDNKELQAVFSYCFGDYGALPKDAPSTMHAMLWNHFDQGACYPYGGASEIAFHIIPVIEKSGGKVLVRAPVKEILLDSAGKAYGVAIERGSTRTEITAPLIVSGAGVANTFGRFLPRPVAQQSRYWKYLSKEYKGHSGLQLFIGLNGSSKDLGLKARNYWCFTGNDLDGKAREYLNMGREAALDSDKPILFAAFPSAKDPSWESRFPGKSVCTVVTFVNYGWFKPWEGKGTVRKRGDDYEGMKKEFELAIWEQICKYFPQLEGKDEYIELGSPLANNYYIGSEQGEIYGLDHGLKRFKPECIMDLRPKTDIPNLYLTGQDVMGAGFSGALYGGLTCASELLGRNLFLDLVGLRKERAALNKKQS